MEPTTRVATFSLAVSLCLAAACAKSAAPATAPQATTPAPAAAPPSGPAAIAADRVASIQKMARSIPSLKEFASSEDAYMDARATLFEPWRRAWLARDADGFNALLKNPGSATEWSSSERHLRREVEGVRELTWAPAVPSQPSAPIVDYLGPFASVEDVQFEVPKFNLTESGGASGLVRFDLRGRTAHGPRQDRGTFTFTLFRTPQGWRIDEIKPLDMETLEADAARTPRFEDATAALGLADVPQVDRREAVRRGGYAVAVSDYDGDGRADILVGNWGPVKLYRNTGARFEDVTEAAGLRGETLVKAAVFADLDNDGLKDLLLLRFVNKDDPALKVDEVPEHAPLDGRRGEGDLVAYRNLGNGKFEYKGDVTIRNQHYDRSMPLAVADFDGNGTLDVYIGFPGSRDFTNDLARQGDPGRLAKQGLWFNDGHWNFTEAPAEWGLLQHGSVFPHAALATDLDGDGRPDIVVIDDSGQANPIYRNDGKGHFTDVTKQWGLAAMGWGMGVTSGDFDGDGLPDLVMTHLQLASYSRYLASPDGKVPGRPQDEQGKWPKDQSTFLFHNLGHGKFEDVTDKSGLGWAGEALAGAQWVDYNNDGLLDLYVMNGLWSGGHEDADSLLGRLVASRERRRPEDPDAAKSKPGETREPNPMLNILRDFRGSLTDPQGGSVSEQPTLSLAGFQRKRLFRNNGDGTFTDVAFFEGADRIEDGYVVAAADVDHNGGEDLILRNADAAPGRQSPTLIVLRNTQGGHSLNVALRGTKSNRDGVGAVVTAIIGTQRVVREIQAVAGASQSEETAFIGLGKANRVDRLEVRWPSGKVESFAAVRAGRVLLTEGKGLIVQADARVPGVSSTAPF